MRSQNTSKLGALIKQKNKVDKIKAANLNKRIRGQAIADNSLKNRGEYGKQEESEGASGAGSSVRETLLEKVENPKLKNAVNEIYRPGATTGDGGLADAVRQELSTGELVGGKSHIKKAMERVTNLENVIKKQDLSSGDLEIANKLLDDLKNALGGK